VTTVNKDHGRIEQREIRVSDCLNHNLDFPYVGQVFRIQRHTYHVKSGRETHETVHGITSLLPNLATPQRLLGLNRNHWGIENKLHWVRDVTFDEDRSQIRTGQAPRVMASLHNLVINVFRICGSKNIAKTIRSFAFNTRRALKLIGL